MCTMGGCQLCDLYENDSIFDKFECTISGNSENVATGSYSNYFRVFNVNSGNESTLEASKTPQRLQRSPVKQQITCVSSSPSSPLNISHSQPEPVPKALHATSRFL